MSNSLKEIVDLIRFNKKMKVEEIATSIGYSRVHLQKEMGKGDNPDLRRLLEEKYPDVILDVSRQLDGYRERYIKLMEQTLKEKKEAIRGLETQINELLKKQEDFLSKTEGMIEQLRHLVLAQLQSKAQPEQGNSPIVAQRVYKQGGNVKKKDKQSKGG